jgi:hypothetical protein
MKVRIIPTSVFFFALLFSPWMRAQDLYVHSTINGKIIYSTSNGLSSFNVEVRGKIELADDDKDVKSMSSDGYLEINKTVFGSKRTLVITPQGNSIKREYYEGRKQIDFEPEGRKWMSDIMPELVRTTTLGAESRVNRLYKQGGVMAVLSEITQLESDYVKAFYANTLMKLPVQAKEYAVVIGKVAETVNSDYYLSEFLQKNLDKFLTNKEATDAVFAACGKMESDHYKTVVIKEALQTQTASPEAVKSILMATGKMESDHYKTEVLTSLLKQNNLTESTISEMINTSKTIGSDYYRSLVLNKALLKSGLSATSCTRVLESVKDINSDFYKSDVMNTLLKTKLSADQIKDLIGISSSIESDHYATQVLNNVLDKQDLSDDAFKSLMDRVAHVSSDYYASTLLRDALKSDNLDNAKVICVLKAASGIGSDYYITEVLMEAATRVKAGDAAIKEAYHAAAKKINSESYYGRAMKAIEN